MKRVEHGFLRPQVFSLFDMCTAMPMVSLPETDEETLASPRSLFSPLTPHTTDQLGKQTTASSSKLPNWKMEMRNKVNESFKTCICIVHLKRSQLSTCKLVVVCGVSFRFWKPAVWGLKHGNNGNLPAEKQGKRGNKLPDAEISFTFGESEKIFTCILNRVFMQRNDGLCS
jgi:hypothetical protein